MKSHLFSLLPQDLVNETAGLSQTISLEEACRLQAHILGDGKMDFTLRRPIRKTLQETLSQNFDTSFLKIIERIEDPADKSIRYLFEASDGSLIEAVKIPLLKVVFKSFLPISFS